MLGEQLPPGVYEYAVRLSIPYLGQYCRPARLRFSGAPAICLPGPTNTFLKDFWSHGAIELNTQVGSALGRGWVLKDHQSLIADEAGRLLVAEGDRLDEYYFELADQLDGLNQNNRAEPPVIGPAAEIEIVPPPLSGGALVSGTITTDTTWTEANSPYIVTEGNVLVPDEVTLTIEPGVTVMLDQYQSLVVQGDLQAVGAATTPITFTAYTDGSFENWQNYTVFDEPAGEPIDFMDVVEGDPFGNIWFAGKTPSELGFLRSGGLALAGSRSRQQRPKSSHGALAINRLAPDLKTWTAYELPNELFVSIIYDIAADTQGRVWFATDDGVALLAADGEWTVYQEGDEHEGETGSLSSNQVQAVAIDETSGQVWFGSESGVDRYSPSLGEWTNFTTTDGLAHNYVYAVEIDGDGNIWFGTNAGISKLTPAMTWTTYGSDPFSDLAVDQQGNIWGVVPSEGVRALLTNTTWLTYTDSGDLQSNMTSSIAVDRYNRKWVGYEDAGVSVLSADNLTWFHETAPKLSRDNVSDIATAADGSIWIGTFNDSGGGGSGDGKRATRIYQEYYRSGTISGGYWGSVQLGGGAVVADSDASQLSYVVMESGGGGNVPSLSLVESAPSLDNLTISGSGGDGLLAADSDGFTLDTATIEGNEGDGLRIEGGSGSYNLSDVTLRTNNGHGLHLDGFFGSIVVEQASLAQNFGYGLFTDGESALELSDSTIEGNAVAARLPADTISMNNTWSANRRNEIEWAGGVIPTSRTWADQVEAYVAFGNITIASEATLTIPAGVKVLFDNGTDLSVAGTLSAIGTVDTPIYLGPVGNSTWSGLSINSGSSSSSLSYVTIAGASTGLAIFSSSPSLEYLTLTGNSYGLQAYDSSLTIQNSNFVDNQIFALANNSSGQVIEASNNYWDAPSGPYHASLNPAATGDAVSNGVNFAPWRRQAVRMAGLQFALVKRTATDRTALDVDDDTGGYIRTYSDGREVYFDSQGRHDYTLAPDGRRTLYTYNPDDTVATMEITAPGEEDPAWVWSFSYDNGRLAGITDPAGRVTDFTLDKNGDLSRVDFADGSSRQFYYNARGLLTQQIDEAGGVTGYVYDDYGRLQQHIAPRRTIFDPETGQVSSGQEVRVFTPSDTAYPLINESATGDPDSPAPAVVRSADLVDKIEFGRGSLSGYTNQWGNWLERTDALSRTTEISRSAANQITSVTLADGSCIEAAYDANGNVIEAVRMDAGQCALAPGQRDPGQQQTSSRTYEPRFNQPKTVTDPAGRVMTYTYDYEVELGEAGRVVRVDFPPVPNENDILTTPSISYTYNSLGLLETETDLRGTVTRYVYTQGTPDEAAGGGNPLFAPGVTPVPGLLTQMIADDGGLDFTTIYRDFNALGSAQTIIYPGGQTKTYTYDELGRLTSETNADDIVTRYEYNAQGQLVSQTHDYTPDGTTGENIVTTFAYDGDGRLIHQRTAADGLVVERFSEYDITGRMVGERDGQGIETRSIYDEAGQLIETIDRAGESTLYTYTDAGLPETVQDPDNHVTRTIYDEFGRPEQIIRADGELDLTTLYTYNSDNTVAQVENPDGSLTCFEYDDLKRRSQTVQDCGPGGLNLTTSYAYDLAGNVVYTTDPRGTVTYTEYDALGRVSLTRQDDGGLNLETVTTYDEAGNVDTTTGPDGAVTSYSYDAMNRLEQSCQDSAGLNLCTSYTYDRLGRQETMTDAEGVVMQTVYNAFDLPVQEIKDVGGIAATTSFEYDNLLNMVRVTDANGNATHYSYTSRQAVETEFYADGATVSYTYDERGNMATRTLQDGATISYTYDAANRREQASFSTGGSQEFAYDDMGRLTEAVQVMNGHTTITGYEYNAVGEVIQTSQQLDSGEAWQVTYAYDYLAGERQVTYPSGAVRVYQMDDLNRLDTVETGGGSPIADYDYDVINRFNTLAYANGLTNRTDFDAAGRISRVRTSTGSAEVADYRYEYDQVGNRTSMRRAHQPGQPAEVYEYDSLYQLISVWYGADATSPGNITSYTSLQTYELDAQGNRLAVVEDDFSQDYAPNNGSQLTHAMNRYNMAGDIPLSYDRRGNTLSDAANRYDYDILNRQIGFTDVNGETEYVYDARGRRVAKITAGITATTTTHYIYDIEYRVIEERDQAEELLARYTYGRGMDEPLTMERAGQTYFYHRDALGSITEVTDENGDLVERYEYDVYGAVTIFNSSGITLTASAIGNPYLFTGREYDLESGNYAYRARYYSPRLGRFLSQDPLGFDAGDYNLYRYVFNNPTNLTDPTGEFAFIPWLLKAGAEAAVDALMQAVVNYYFNPEVHSVDEAIASIHWGQVGWAFVTGLLPGGNIVQSILGAGGDVFIAWLDALSNCENYTPEQAIRDFAMNFVVELIGAYTGDFVAKYGAIAVAKGLRRLGLDDVAERVLKNADEGIPGGGVCNFNSFSADTLVATDEGLEAISHLEVGDDVLAYHEATKEVNYYPIVGVWLHQDPVIVYLTLDEEVIETTPEHPFYTAEDKWIIAEALQKGDRIRQADGGYGTVEAVEVVYQPQPMYNLTVAEAHTFFVGEGRWLVHNACSSKLDRALGGTVGDNLQAHHLIPGELETHPIVDRAIRAGWNIDGKNNGILLPSTRELSLSLGLPIHNTNHPAYTQIVRNRLNALAGRINGLSNQQVIQELDMIASDMRSYLQSLGGGVPVPK